MFALPSYTGLKDDSVGYSGQFKQHVFQDELKYLAKKVCKRSRTDSKYGTGALDLSRSAILNIPLSGTSVFLYPLFSSRSTKMSSSSFPTILFDLIP